MKLFLLEDDDNLGDALVYSLKGEGMEVLRASCIAEAMALFPHSGCDLALLDVMLPDGSGYDFCEWVRKTDEDIPVIFLTALEDEENVVHAFGTGADDYVTKPFRTGELLARIRANVRRAGGMREKKLDDTRLCVWKRGERIDLSPAEFKLLKHLTEEKGRVLSREQLLSLLWESDTSEMDANTVSVYIRRLRDKLDDASEKSCITTIRGEGYRWEGWT